MIVSVKADGEPFGIFAKHAHDARRVPAEIVGDKGNGGVEIVPLGEFEQGLEMDEAIGLS